MQGTRLLTVLVALGLIVGTVPGGALASATGAGDTTDIDATAGAAQTDDGNTTTSESSAAGDGGNVSRATVGQQLATVIAVTDDEVSSDVEASSLDAALADANESARATILAERAAALHDRADEVVTDQREARVAYEDGEITRGEFAQRLAVLAGQARTVDSDFERVDEHASNVSGLELRAAGYNASANEEAKQRLSRVTGTGASALLAQYTGERAGEFSLAVNGGVSIEVESDDGERSREIERDQPGDGSFEVTQSEALSAATAQLSTDVDGEWTLRSADRDEDDGYYEFEFVLAGPNTTGEAEVSVDGQTGDVFEFEEEIEPRERDDEDGDNETPLSISIVDGTAEPGAAVMLRVTAAGEPVEGATVELDDDDLGTTDSDGQIAVTLPDDDEVEIKVADDEREGELEVRLRSNVDDDRDEDLRERLAVDGTVENGTVTASVTYNDTGVDGFSAYVDGDRVGVTDEDGTVSFDAPTADEELEVTLVKGSFEAELTFDIGANGTLVLDTIDVDEGDDADLSVSIVSGDPGPSATVTVEVTDANGDPVEGASVEVADTYAGTTNADGQITVTLPADGEAEIDVDGDDRDGELTVAYDAVDEGVETDGDTDEDADGDNGDDAEDNDDDADDGDDDDDGDGDAEDDE